MAASRTANEVFDSEFLPVRAKLLELAASLDRLDRVGYDGHADPRRLQVQAAIQILLRPDQDRAEQLQLLFSRPYQDDWRAKMGI